MSDTPNLAAALVAAQKDMPKVEPDGKANYGAYVTLDHLIAKTRPVLQKHGLAIVQEPTFVPGGTPALKTTLMHSSGEWVASVMPLLFEGNNMQKLGAAITYARRYAWAALLGISEQEDDDGEKASRISGKEKTPAKPAAAHPAAGPDPKAAPAGEEPPGAAAPTDEQLEALFKLITDKGGDEAGERAAMDTARAEGKLADRYRGALKYYSAQPDSFANKVPAKAKAA